MNSTLTLEDVPAKDGQVGGKLEMAEDVVATIAGLAARDVEGLHSLGKSRFISFGDDPTRGVGVEVGEHEAALDLEVVIKYGCDIHKMAEGLRKRIAETVFQMAGRKVVEVNISVVGIQVEEKKEPEAPEPAPRVR